MKIEILYPEICTLFGDKGNIMYLSQCLPEAELIYTGINETPRFLNEKIDLVYMCSMSEKSQELILQKWMPLRSDINSALQNGSSLFLFTGNAMELLGNHIEREDGSVVEALDFVPEMCAVRQTPDRFNTLIKADFQEMTLIGYSSRFSHTFGIPEENAFCQVAIGFGSNPESQFEGFYSKNCIATYLLGPLLIQNPDFTLFLLEKLGVSEPSLPFEAELRNAYSVKSKEFDQPGLKLS